MYRKGFVLLGVLAITAAAYWYSLPRSQKPSEEKNISELITRSRWKTYTNDRLDFKISFPASFEASESGNHTFQIFSTPTNSVLIAVLPPELRPNDELNFGGFQTFMSLNVGERFTFPNAQFTEQAESFTYERLPDVDISDIWAPTFVNKKPWGFPPGTTEYRHMVQRGDIIYLIVGYTGNALPVDIFDDIVDSIRIGL